MSDTKCVPCSRGECENCTGGCGCGNGLVCPLPVPPVEKTFAEWAEDYEIPTLLHTESGLIQTDDGS